MFVFNYVHNLVPKTFNEFYRFRSFVHEHDTRRCDDLFVDIQSSVRSGFTLKYISASVRNSLRTEARSVMLFTLKFESFSQLYFSRTKNFSIRSETSRRKQLFSYTE